MGPPRGRPRPAHRVLPGHSSTTARPVHRGRVRHRRGAVRRAAGADHQGAAARVRRPGGRVRAAAEAAERLPAGRHPADAGPAAGRTSQGPRRPAGPGPVGASARRRYLPGGVARRRRLSAAGRLDRVPRPGPGCDSSTVGPVAPLGVRAVRRGRPEEGPAAGHCPGRQPTEGDTGAAALSLAGGWLAPRLPPERPGRRGGSDCAEPGGPAAPRPARGGQPGGRALPGARGPLSSGAARGGDAAGAVGRTGCRLRRGRQARRRGPLLAQRPLGPAAPYAAVGLGLGAVRSPGRRSR